MALWRLVLNHSVQAIQCFHQLESIYTSIYVKKRLLRSKLSRVLRYRRRKHG